MNIKSVLSVRVLVVIGVTALIVALPVLGLMQQSAVAAPPPPLRGPFKFIEVPSDNQAGNISTLTQPTRTVIYSDTFNSFVPVVNPSVSRPGWQLFVNSGATDQKWGRVLFSDSAFTNTLWSTGYYSPVQSAGSTYVPNMDAWVVYGPLDAQAYRQFEATFSFYLDTNPGAEFGWAASSDGTNFCGQSLSGHIGKWISATFEMPSCPGDAKRPIYLAFLFQSNGATPNGLGAFVDNLTISGVPWQNIYLPYVRREPTPTAPPASPTPTFTGVRSWDFEPSSDNSAWCSTSNNDWSSGERYMGNSNAYFLRVKQAEYLAMLSPRYTTPSNYRITAQFNFLNFNTGRSLGDYGSAQFGLIFGVNSLAFPPGDDQQCSWGDSSQGGWYKFMLKIKDGGGGYVTRLERFDQNQPWTLLNESNLPSGLTISRSAWNTMTLDRNGSGIAAYINGIQVLSLSDGTYKGGRWFGIFTETLGNNAGGVFESDWDNIQIYNLTP